MRAALIRRTQFSSENSQRSKSSSDSDKPEQHYLAMKNYNSVHQKLAMNAIFRNTTEERHYNYVTSIAKLVLKIMSSSALY